MSVYTIKKRPDCINFYVHVYKERPKAAHMGSTYEYTNPATNLLHERFKL